MQHSYVRYLYMNVKCLPRHALSDSTLTPSKSSTYTLIHNVVSATDIYKIIKIYISAGATSTYTSLYYTRYIATN